MDQKQLKALAARRYEKIEPLNKPGEKATYKTVQVFKDTSFLRRKNMRPELLEEGEFPTCARCIYSFLTKTSLLQCRREPNNPRSVKWVEEDGWCGEGQCMVIYGAGNQPIAVAFDELFEDLYVEEWERLGEK